MIGRTNAGGVGGRAYGYIYAEYVPGRTCTCTNGVKTLTAKDTSGIYVFGVPSAGSWTVSDGVLSKTVTISSQYETVLIVLRVPSTYQEVEYLQSSGTQYINTPALWQSDIRIVTNFEETTMVGSYPKAFGVEDSSNVGAYKMDIRTGSNGWRFGYGQTENTVGTYNLNTKYKLETDNNLIYVDDVLKVTCGTSKLPTTTKTIYLFAENSGNSATQFSAIKLYDFKVYYNNVLNYDFVPCYRISDSVAGLYDRVNDVFYINNGTGTFTVGGNV